MTILEELKKRSEQKQDDIKIDLKLYNLADDIEKDARNHLKRVITVLSEFDIHDEKHSEKVISNIESLLGSTINELSSYELFLLHLSSFLHDCAMAPSQYEIDTMKLTEGNDTFFQQENSIKHDLKSPLKHSEALNVINNNKQLLYKDFSHPSKWTFCNSTEKDFVSYLADLLIDYQNFRNGFARELRNINNNEEFKAINEFIRIDYIRATHHIRVETYIKNLETKFGNAFMQPSWGKKLANDLAKICRSHGESVEYIEQLSTNSQYYGNSSANLQMVAAMLRLGDIIHYSFDRAPLTILSSKIFKSEYSFQEWAVKNSGANYSIENGLISYRAYCETPEIYFKLHQYIDWIEIEIQNYFKFQRKWNFEYIKNLKDKVERTNITNDESKFLPKRGLGFSLNQKKILELLKGVGLYKDEFAYLRELYQNSLDACKCMISKNKTISIHSKGNIDFGIVENEEGKYLYCLDNGIGMSKEIIEKYLLNIGNSYYNSSDFYKEQSNWDGSFTPTSQFGIGILSCFMIGTRIEITTKSEKGEYISCVINGIHENFFYKITEISDKEKIINTGTLVKVFLMDKVAQNLEYSPIKKLGLLLLGIQRTGHVPDTDIKWEKHIYNHVNSFISIVPENINISVKLKDEKTLPILSKPINLFDYQELLDIDIIKDKKLINDILFWHITENNAPTIKDIQENISIYPISIEKNNIIFTSLISLPNKHLNFSFKKYNSRHFFINNRGISIDGISVEDGRISQFEHYFTNQLSQYEGNLDFSGELRPKISVDRKSIISYPEACEKQVENIVIDYIKKAVEIAKNHINKYNISENTPEFNLVWDYILDKVNFADILFINELSETEYGDIQSNELNYVVGENITIKEFIYRKKVHLKNFHFNEVSQLTKKMLLSKLICADSIDVEGDCIEITMANFNKNSICNNGYDFRDNKLLFNTEKWNIFNNDYDLVTGLYPLIPKRLFDKLYNRESEIDTSKIKSFHNYTNGIVGVLLQSPLLVNSKMGMYVGDNNIHSGGTNIYNFDKKRGDIHIMELQNKKYVLMMYISPKKLSKNEELELQKYEDTDSEYVKGVKEGWSVLITTMKKDNTVIIAGKTTRENLVNKLSDDFWEEYKDYEFRFTDETLMIKK